MPSCVKCHAQQSGTLANSVHAHPRGKGTKPLDCATCHGALPHEVPKLAAQTAQRLAVCRDCHQEEFQQLAHSVHGGEKRVKGERPNCLSCHNDGPHGISTARAPSPKWQTSCGQCHTDIVKSVTGSAHGNYARENGAKIGCFSCHGDNPHTLANPTKGRGETKDAYCQQCHQDVAGMLAASAHGKGDNPTGKQLSCHACHGESPHDISPAKHLTRMEKSAKCEGCHADSMKRLVNSAHGMALRARRT